MGYINEIRNYEPKNEQEAQDKKVIMHCLTLFPSNILLRDNEIVHMSSSGFIVNKTADKCLMVHHNIRNAWAFTGGHADGNSNLLEVAIQEAVEETGIKIKPLSNEIASVEILTVSEHIKKGCFVNSHLHLNVTYIFVGNEDEKPIVKPDENSAVEWISAEKINEPLFAARDVYLYGKLLQQARTWLVT